MLRTAGRADSCSIEDDLTTAQVANRVYSNDHYSRLLAVKQQYDPANVIKFATSIRPIPSTDATR